MNCETARLEIGADPGAAAPHLDELVLRLR